MEDNQPQTMYNDSYNKTTLFYFIFKLHLVYCLQHKNIVFFYDK